MPIERSVSASPTPDSSSNCGDCSEPAARITSRRARTVRITPPCRYSTPTARRSSNTIARRVRSRPHVEVWPVAIGREIGSRRTPAFAVLLRQLIESDAFLLRAVEVDIAPQTLRFRRCEPQLREAAGRARIGDIERTALPMEGIDEAFVVFRAPEKGQHLGVRPAPVTERRPGIVVAAMPPRVDHRVDRARAAQRLAARLITAAPAQSGLWRGLERPVVDRMGNQQRETERHADEQAAIGRAGLEERYPN